MCIKKKMKGFTLVEVMVVVIIIAVLAAVAIPLMTGNVKRAVSSEGIAGLGTARSNLRAMFAETQDYTTTPNNKTLVANQEIVGNVPGFSAGDLNGRYFIDSEYVIHEVSASNFVIRVQNSGTGIDVAPGRKKAEGFIIWMTSQGTIVRNEAAGGEAGATAPAADK